MFHRRRPLPRGFARLVVLVLLAGALPSATRAASLSAQEIIVLGKALAFAHLPADATGVTVVYAAGNAESRADAAQIAEEIGDGFQVNGRLLTPSVVDAAELAASRPAVIITALGASSGAVAGIARTQHALCVTADLAAVRAGLCMMTIRSPPHGFLGRLRGPIGRGPPASG
jgi:hypothetical protein